MWRPPKQMRKAPEAGPRGRRQSPKYQSQRCRPSKESQTRTRPSKSVQRVWHHSRHRRGGNRRAWAGRNSPSFPFSVYPLASGWSFGAVPGVRQDPQEGAPPFTMQCRIYPLCLTPVQLHWPSFCSLTCHCLLPPAFALAVPAAPTPHSGCTPMWLLRHTFPDLLI